MSSGPNFFNYRKLLTTPLKKSNLITDLADVCNEVLGKEVEERRRRLEKSRDSVLYRKGQIVSWFDYLPEKDNLAYDIETNQPIEIPIGSTIPKARVVQLVSNIGVYGEVSAIDYLKVEFETNDGKTIRWNMPLNLPQERSLLISNAYMSGFDFYSTTLSDEDYQRLYEFLNMFWPENGIDDNFIKFIGFIKNLKLELAPLWSENNNTDKITILEEMNETRKKVTEGGPWYLTSHVAINYDLKQQSDLYPINFDEIERLFYLFAPIMLVLERIVGKLDVFIEIGRASTPIADVVNYGISERDPNVLINHYRLAVTDAAITNYGVFRDPVYMDDLDEDLRDDVVSDTNLYSTDRATSFSVKLFENGEFLNSQDFDFRLVLNVRGGGLDQQFIASTENNLLYYYDKYLMCYVPYTDYFVNFATSTYTYKLFYKRKFGNDFKLFSQGLILKYQA